MNYPDIFFTPEYQDLFKDTAFGGEPCHINYAGIDYRFYKCPIKGTDYFDIVSPYGYSGMVPVEDDFDWDDYLNMSGLYYESENIIAEFARLHPFELDVGDIAHLHSWPDYACHYEREVVYIDLTKPSKFDKGCKSSIRKADRIVIKRDLADISPYDFYQVYNETMLRDNSDPKYLFNLEFFDKLFDLPGIVFGAYRDNQMIAGISVLVSKDYAHYFLSGSTLEARSLSVNNLLLWEAIRWAKTQGCKTFNLGGGLREGDSLESFKKSFSKTTKPFYTYKKVHNQKVYDELSKEIKTDYFPAYRRLG